MSVDLAGLGRAVIDLIEKEHGPTPPVPPEIHVVMRAATSDDTSHDFIRVHDGPPTLDELAADAQARALAEKASEKAANSPVEARGYQDPTQGSDLDLRSVPAYATEAESSLSLLGNRRLYSPEHAAERERLTRATRTGSDADRKVAAENLKIWLSGGTIPA